MRIFWALCALCCLAACGGKKEGTGDEGHSPTGPVLRFTAIPDQDATRLKQKFDPVGAYLADALGVEVAYVPVKDYAASVEGFKNGEIHLAWFGGLTGVQARHAVDGARAIAQGIEDPQFVSYFIAHRDTGIEPSDTFPMGMEGRSFTFGSESSTSGRLMPEFFVQEHTGKSPRDFFSSVGFSGDHDKTVELVASGAVEVGAVNYKVYDRRVAEGQTDPETCVIVWRTPPYADYNFTAHPALEEMYGEGFIDRLQGALVAMKDEALLSAFPREALIPATNEEFEGIRVVAEGLGFLD
ncbi:MAG: putative selenate ABC transporter substrate-binding protein [Planctomycetota bacterium]|jgi:phosphonate transport system substrate-binding protein